MGICLSFGVWTTWHCDVMGIIGDYEIPPASSSQLQQLCGSNLLTTLTWANISLFLFCCSLSAIDVDNEVMGRYANIVSGCITRSISIDPEVRKSLFFKWLLLWTSCAEHGYCINYYAICALAADRSRFWYGNKIIWLHIYIYIYSDNLWFLPKRSLLELIVTNKISVNKGFLVIKLTKILKTYFDV